MFIIYFLYLHIYYYNLSISISHKCSHRFSRSLPDLLPHHPHPPPPPPPSPSTTMMDLSSTRVLISPPFDEEKAIEVEPFLPRASSYTSTSAAARISNFYKKRRRRTLNETDGGSGRSQSFRERAASDSAVTGLCVNLVRYVG